MRTFLFFALLACVAAGPATRSARPAAPPTSKPSTTRPARADPAFVAEFNQKLINSKFDDVIAKLREMGAIFSGPRETGKDTQRAAGPLTSYSVRLGHAWEFGTYRFRVDAKGLIQHYEFDTLTDGDRGFAQRLNAGNRWYWVQYRIGRSAAEEDAIATRIQARTAAAAEAQVIADHEMLLKREYEVRKQERPAWAKLRDVKAFDWFEPRLPSMRSERPD